MNTFFFPAATRKGAAGTFFTLCCFISFSYCFTVFFVLCTYPLAKPPSGSDTACDLEQKAAQSCRPVRRKLPPPIYLSILFLFTLVPATSRSWRFSPLLRRRRTLLNIALPGFACLNTYPATFRSWSLTLSYQVSCPRRPSSYAPMYCFHQVLIAGTQCQRLLGAGALRSSFSPLQLPPPSSS